MKGGNPHFFLHSPTCCADADALNNARAQLNTLKKEIAPHMKAQAEAKKQGAVYDSAAVDALLLQKDRLEGRIAKNEVVVAQMERILEEQLVRVGVRRWFDELRPTFFAQNKLGNIVDASVPVHNDEAFNRVERTWGTNADVGKVRSLVCCRGLTGGNRPPCTTRTSCGALVPTRTTLARRLPASAGISSPTAVSSSTWVRIVPTTPWVHLTATSCSAAKLRHGFPPQARLSGAAAPFFSPSPAHHRQADRNAALHEPKRHGQDRAAV